MTYNNIYYSLWEKFLPAILVQMKNAKNGEKEIKLFKSEFAALGKKPASEFFFTFDIVNGKLVVPNLKTTAVARDLFDKLSGDAQVRNLLVNNHFQFSLGKEFILKIQSFPFELVPEEMEPHLI